MKFKVMREVEVEADYVELRVGVLPHFEVIHACEIIRLDCWRIGRLE